MDNHIILFGAPRSGTTWLSEILSSDGQLHLVHEPDNELISFPGLVYKTNLNRFPYLRQTDILRNYKKLYSLALNSVLYDYKSKENYLPFKLYGLSKEKIQNNLIQYGSGNIKNIWFSEFIIKRLIKNHMNTRTLIKTVHGILAIPFLMKHFDIQAVLMRRHPLNIFSSYVNLSMPDRDRKLYDNITFLEDHQIPKLIAHKKYGMEFKSGYQLGAINKHFDFIEKNHPEIIQIDYEILIQNPIENIQTLFDQLSLKFTESTKKYISSRFKDGEGYATLREPKKQFRVWEKRLKTHQVDEFLKGYEFSYGSINFNL